jgi:NADH:ubiquinone oxidoreductase subunit 6 (subunit J)
MVDLLIALFITVAVLEVVSAILVFKFRIALHAAAALAVLFFANALAFLLLSQPLLAIMQLFVMVGGVSTYLFVSVASANYPSLNPKRALAFGLLAASLFAVMVYPLVSTNINANQNNIVSLSTLDSYMSNSLPFFYMIAAVLFGVSLGAIIILKKVGAK